MVAEANRIFGFDGWDRETVSSDCVWTRQVGQRFCAAYVARVRITVRAGETRIIREGCGVGDSNGLTPGQAHDFAAKAAETDATKRALMTFGNAFGLSLYKGAGGAQMIPHGRPAAKPSESQLLHPWRSSRPQRGHRVDGDAFAKPKLLRPINSRAKSECDGGRYLPARSRRTRLSAQGSTSPSSHWRSQSASAMPITSVMLPANLALSAGGHQVRRTTFASPNPAP